MVPGSVRKDPVRLLVIVVNFNQEPEIQAFLNELCDHWPREQTIVVDDGSRDGSPALAEQCGYRVLRHPENRGVGAAIRTGIEFAHERGFQAVAIMSSNGKMRPKELASVVTPVLEGRATYVTGSRYIRGGQSPGLPWFRKISIPLFSLFMSLLLRRWFTDITCGFRAYRVDFLYSSRVQIGQAWLDRYEMEYYIHFWACRLGQTILEVPVTIRYDHLPKGRHSKIPAVTGWWSMIRPIVLLSLRMKK
jgi:dolichol-phosphate mannosyltransferase